MDGIIRHTYSRLTLYDLLAMLLPGILFVGEILYLLDIPLENKISVSLIVLLAYPAGLVLHSLSECVWNGCCKSKRKDKCEKEAPPSADNNKDDSKQTDTDKKKIDTITMKQCFCKCKKGWCHCKLYGLRNDPEHIKEELQVTLQYAPSGNVYKLTNSVREDNQLLDKYNEAYYYVVDVKQHENTIRTLEGQIAMMRSLIIPFVLLVVVVIKCFCCNAVHYVCCCTGHDVPHWMNVLIVIIVSFLIIATAIGLHYSAVCKQKAIYHRVWEDYEYLRRMESNYEKTK